MPCPLDRLGQRSLVFGAGAGLASGLHASSFGDVAANPGYILVVYGGHVLHAEGAYSTPGKIPGPPTSSGTSRSEPANHGSVLLL